MISSTGESPRADRYRSLVMFLHPSLSVLFPLLFLSLLFYLGADPFLRIDSGIRFTLPFILLAVGSGAYLLQWWRRKERVGGAGSLLREMLLTLAASGLVILAVSGRLFSLPGSLRSAGVWIALILTLLQWLLTTSLYRALRQRELFLELFVDRSGAELPTIYRDNGQEAARALEGLHSVHRSIVRFLALATVLLVVVHWGIGLPGSVLETTAFVVLFVLGLFALRTMRVLETEQLALADGARVLPATLTTATVAAALLVLAAFLLALPIVGRHAPLPDSVLLRLWLAIVALFNRLPSGSYVPRSLPPPIRPELPTIAARIGRLPHSEPPAWALLLGEVLRVAGWVLLGAAVAALLIFLARPLFGMSLRRGAFDRAFRAVVTYVEELVYLIGVRVRAGISNLFGSRRTGGNHAQKTARGARGAGTMGAEDALGGGQGGPRGRELPLGLFRRAFRRLIRWGERHGIPHDPACAPAEYASRLARCFPAAGEELADIATIYEEGIYSTHMLSDERLDRYLRGVRRVIGANR